MSLLKRASVIICALALMLLVGCGAGNDAANTIDKKFIGDLSGGLQERWKINEAEGSSRESLIKAVDAEIKHVEKYKNETFEDQALGEKAKKYCDNLEQSKKAAGYYDSDYSKYIEQWSELQDQRYILIEDFVNNHGLAVSSEYKKNLDDLVSRASSAKEKAEEKAAVEQLCKAMQFQPAENHEYQCVLENTTSYNFKSFSASINLLDNDGVIVNSTYTSVDNWAPGQKARFEFFTMDDFNSMDIKPSYYTVG